MIIYNFLKNILRDEYRNICQKNIKINNEIKDSDKKKKVHRKNILIDIQSV
jgi:hypothetical protein